jgi:hypothetical protein
MGKAEGGTEVGDSLDSGLVPDGTQDVPEDAPDRAAREGALVFRLEFGIKVIVVAWVVDDGPPVWGGFDEFQGGLGTAIDQFHNFLIDLGDLGLDIGRDFGRRGGRFGT